MSDPRTPGEQPVNGPLDHRDATYYQIPRRRRPVLRVLMWSVIGLLGLGGAGALYANQLAQRALSNEANNSPEVKAAAKLTAVAPPNLTARAFNILIIGSDNRPKEGRNTGRSDTLILVRLDVKRSFISMLSFPRDLFVPIPGLGENKINAAYATGGIERTIQTVINLTGERPDYFFNVDFNAFKTLVNKVGGVYLDIDHWYFNDNSGSGENFEPLNIQPGYQKLKGADALDYVRYRHDSGDFARIARQQAFLSELKRQNKGIRGLDRIVDSIHDNVVTNLKSTGRLKDFLQFGLSIEKERIARVTIQETGEGSTSCCGSVVYTSPQKIKEAVELWKNPTFVSERQGKAKPPSELTVTVYNGSKKIGLGTEVSQRLEAKGYTVQFGGNAPDFYQSTAVFYGPKRNNEAKVLQPQFGPNASVGERRQGQTTASDLIVIVGADYNGLVTPPKVKPTKTRPVTIATTSLKKTVQGARSITGLDFLVPLHLPPNSDVRWTRLYSVDRGDRGKPDTLTFVVRLGGANRYFTITQTAKKNPPIVDTATGRDPKGGGITFYNGKKMQRLLWQRGNMTYWITNSLDETLTAETIRDIRQFMVRPAKAKLKAGVTDTRVPVQEKSRTP